MPVPANVTSLELRITVARFLEVAYRKDQQLTGKLIKEAGPVKLSVDSNGKARLSGSAGAVSFKETLNNSSLPR